MPERLDIERLESRILMAADPLSFVANQNIAQDITLSIIDKAGVATIQITDTATSAVILQKSVADTLRVNITLSNRSDTIRITNDFSSFVPVAIDGRGGTDTLVAQSTPTSGATFSITGANTGFVDGASFTQISRLQGANNLADLFVFGPGGSMSGGIDGGAGAVNTVVGHAGGATFTETGLDRGTIQQNSSSATTSFGNVGKLQGGAGADTFVANAGAALTSGFDGGGGANVARSTVSGTTYTVTGANAGLIGTIAFSNVGKIQGLSGAADRFLVSAGASLTQGIDGLGAGNNTLVGPSGGAAYSVTGFNAGSVGGVGFVNVGRLQGANGFADTFTFSAGGALTSGIDGGTGGQNTIQSAPTGATFTLNGANAGTVQETGSVRVTNFSNIDKLQGGAGGDTLVVNAGTLANGFDGGAGVNTVRGPAAGATYNVTGTDVGNVAGISFTNVGRLQGGTGADTFVLGLGAALTGGFDGGTGVNTLAAGPSGATFNISGRDSGTVGAATFANIGRLRGADGAADTFTFSAGGSLSGGLDGGTGGQNTVVAATTGMTFTLTGAGIGTAQETGSAFSTGFTAIDKLQGGSGADTLVVNAGSSLANGFDGGAGVNTVRGPAAGATFTVTGTDAGNVAGVSFTNVGRLQGGVGADTFVVGSGGALTGGFDGGAGVNTVAAGPSGASFNISGRDSGTVGTATFTNVGRLRGADGAADTFTFTAGGSLSGGLDGGAGGQNTVVGANTGTTFTMTGAGVGSAQEAGSAFSTGFANIDKLQGGTGADTLVVNAGSSLANGFDGGAGVNTVRGPAAGATYNVSGLDAGNVAGVSFTRVGKLQGANNAPDTFNLLPGGALTTGIDGGAGQPNTIVGPSTGTTFAVTARDAGTVGTTAFTNVGQLRGADNAPDTFTMGPNGSLSGGIDGGLGGQNKLVGPSTGATFTITGQDAGTVGTTAFVNIGQLQGADNAADSFVVRPGGSLTTGLDGGLGGQNTLTGPATGATFTVVRLDGGSIQERNATAVTLFNNVGNLRGADNVADLFVIDPAGSLTGGVVGGADSTDTLRLFGTVVDANYIATGPQSGRYELDDRRVTFSGIETIEDNVVAQNRLVRGTEGADFLTVSQTGNIVRVSAPSIDPISFQRPSVSLTVEGGGGIDSILVISDLMLPNTNLRLASEFITVINERIDTTGTVRGNVVFDSLGSVTTGSVTVNDVANGSVSTSISLVTLLNATVVAGGAIVVNAAANYTGGLTGQAAAAFGVIESATVAISGSSLTANGLVTVAATTNADVTVTATGNGGRSTGDVAVATTSLNLFSLLTLNNANFSSGASISLLSGAKVRSVTTADAASANFGGAAADTIGVIRTAVLLTGTNAFTAGTAAGSAVTVGAKSEADISTLARASTGGVSGSTPRTTSLLTGANAATTEGPVRAAAAVAINAVTGNNNVNFDGNVTVTAPGGLTLSSTDTHAIVATADSTATSTSSGLAAAVAINVVDATSDAIIVGSLTLTGSQLNIAAEENSTVAATAVSGRGSEGGTGLAGALAINDVSVKPTASTGPAAQLTLNGARVTMSATVTSAATARSSAAVSTGGAAIGVGPSIALNFSDNDLTVSLAGNVVGAGQVSLIGAGADSLLTQANGGAAGGTAVTPALALSSSDNDSMVAVRPGAALTTAGNLALDLDRSQSIATTADASVQATRVGIGAALALSFGFQNAAARIERNVTAGSVAVSNRFRADETTNAVAGARGVDAGNRRGNARGQLGNELSFVNNRTGQTAAQPDTQTSSGEFGLAAALALNIQGGSVDSIIAQGVTVRSTGGGVTVESLSDFDAAATADASLVRPAFNVGIAAAVAINSLTPQTLAQIDGTVVAAQGVTVRAGQATDVSSPGIDKVSAKAVAGAGGNTFGGAGSLGLNLLNMNSRANVSATANVTSGALFSIAADNATDATTIATADASSGAAGGSGVGFGIAVALTVTKNNVTARIDGAAVVTSSGGLSIAATGSYAVRGEAEAGGVGGSVGVSPSTFIVVSQNNTLAEIAAPPANGTGLTLSGPVTLSAVHASSIDGVAGSAGSGATAGIGLSFALAVVEDSAKALFSRSVTTAAGNVTGRASNVIDVALLARASSAGGTGNGQSNADGQVGRELGFANQKKGGVAATAPKAETSGGSFGLAGALALSIVNSQTTAQQARATTLAANAGSLTLEAVSDIDSSAIADASLVRPASVAGIGAAVAINAIAPTTLAQIDGTVNASQGVTVRTGQATDASSPGVNKVVAKAVAGAGGNTFGGAGSLGLNVLGQTSRAIVSGTANVTSGAQLALSAAQATDTTTIATADATSGSGGSGVGVGIGVAITVAKNIVTAVVDGAALIATGDGGLSLSATGAHAVQGEAKAGSASGSVGVAPSTFIVVSQNDTLAELAAPPTGNAVLSLRGPVALSALHTSTINGTAAAAGAGSTAGIGLSLTLAVVEDSAKALISRSLATTGAAANVSARASNLVDVTLASRASAAGGSGNGSSNSDAQIGKELGFANQKKGGTAATARSAETPDANGTAGKVGIAGAVSLSIMNSQSRAALAAGRSVTTPGSVTIEAVGDADSRVRADASGVNNNLPQYGVGVAVAMNMANHTTIATVDGAVSSAGLAIRAISPAGSDSYSDLSATAISGTGARNVGVAGAFAANFVDMTNRALLNVATTQTAAGDVEIRSQLLTRPEAVASSSVAAASGGNGNGGAVGVGLSVALNILTNESTAAIPNGITLTGGRNVTIAAQGENLTKTWAVSGSSQGSVGIAPALALLVAENKTTATLGTGVPLSLTGGFTLSSQHKVTGDTKSDAGVKGASDVGVGAAVALNIVEDVADASPLRSLTTGGDIVVSADLVANVAATAIASTTGASRSSGPTTTDGQIGAVTAFGNRQSGVNSTAPQVAKTNGGSGAEQSVGVAAALAVNVVNTHARATLPASISVASGRGVAVLSAMDVDGSAIADGSVAQQATGVGVAVALNVIIADNTALVLTPINANGAVTVRASMSAFGDGVDTFVARANAGVGSTQIGVAGAVALEILNLPTKAQILSSVNAGGGYVTVSAENKSNSSAIATSRATVRGQSGGSSGTGVGASFALSVLNLPAQAEVPDNVAITNAGGLTINASGDHVAVTTAEAGSAGNVSISPAVAIHVATSDTTARLGSGAALTTVGSGGVRIEANHRGDYQARADGSAGGSNVAVGAAIALGVVLEHAGATIARDINAAGDVRIRATNAMASGADATGAAKGNNPNASDADGESQSALNNNSNVSKNPKVAGLPGGKIALPKAGDGASQGSSTSAAQAAGRGGAKVGVGAAIGINFVDTDALATVPAGRSVTSRAGEIEVSSALQIDGTAKAIGTAIVDALKNTSVGAGVALNVINATNAATVGDDAVLNAARGVRVAATMAQINGNAVNDMVVQGAGAAGASKYGVAGAVAIDIITYDTRAELGQRSNVNAGSGAVDVAAQADFTVQNLAGSAAFGANAGVGAAVLVQSSTIGTTAIVKQNSQVDGVGGVHVTAETSYVPRADNFKGFGFALTSGAFGGAGSNGGTAIGGSVAVTVLNMNTEARLDADVKVNQRNTPTGTVVVDAASTVVLFSGAGGVGVATGNLGIGAGIDIAVVNQKTLALIGDRARIAAGGDVSVQAHSSNNMTSIAGSFGLSGSNGGSGSIAVSIFNQGSDALYGTRAIIGADAIVNAGGKVSVIASNPRNGAGELITDSLRVVTGSIAGASSAAVGIATSIAIRRDTFIASVGDRSQVRMVRGLEVAATGGLDGTMVAAAGVGGLENGVAGSVTVSILAQNALATIGQSAVVNSTLNTPADVKVTAESRTRLIKVAGAATFGSDLGIGAGLDVGVLTKTTTALIGAGSQVLTSGSVEVRAFSKEKTNAFAASVGGSTELALAGSVGVQVNSITTRAFIEGTVSGAATQVLAGGNVVVEAAAENEMDLFAGGLAFAGSTGVGVAAPIPVINKITEAFIGQNAAVTAYGYSPAATVRSGGFTVSYVNAPTSGPREATTPLTGSASFSLNGKVAETGGAGTPSAGESSTTVNKQRVVTAGTVNVRGVSVSATNYDDIGVIAISGGAAGSVSVNVTGAVNVSNITTSGRIEKGASVNTNNMYPAYTDQNVLVVGSNDYRSLIVSIGAGVAGTAAVAPAVAVNVVNLTAEAVIAGTAIVHASNSVGVKARNSGDIQAVVASVGIAGTAGISGSPAILVLDDRTTARIGDIGVNGDVAATVRAGGSVIVQATDDTTILDVDGSIGIGGTAGAGVGLVINTVSKDTTARIAAGSVVDAGAASGVSGVANLGGVDGRYGGTSIWSGLLVLAGSRESVSSIAIAGSAAGTIGGSGAVNINLIKSNTAATIGDFARINQNVVGSSGQDVRVHASNEVYAVAVTGGLGFGGTGGLAGAVGIGIVRNGVEASIGSNAVVSAARTVSVQALSKQDIVAVDISGGLGGTFGGAISAGIWVLGGSFSTGGGAASESEWATKYQNTLTGAALQGFSGMLGGNRPFTFVNGDVGGNAITLRNTALGTGDAVIYHSNGNAAGNLVDGRTYFLIKTGANSYALAATAADADAGRAVSLGTLRGGSLEMADNSRAQPGLQQARNGIVNATPTNRLSDSLEPGPGQPGTVALVKSGATIVARGGMSVIASDGLDFVQVTGEVALGGTAGIGGAFATLIHNNTVLAQIGDNVTITANGAGLDVEAVSGEDVVQIAAGGGAGGAAGIFGSATVTILNETTNAGLGRGVRVTGSSVSGSNPDVKVIARDFTKVTDVAGVVGFGGAAAVGVGADVVSLSKTTLATIDQDVRIDTDGSVELRAQTSEEVVSVAAVGSFAGAAAVNLSASVVVANIITQAFIKASPSTVIDADGNVVVEAASRSEFDLWGIAAQFAGAAAIGAAAAVPVITKNVLAEVGDGTTVTGRGIRNATTVQNGTFGDRPGGSNTDVQSSEAGGRNLGLGSPSYSNGSNSDLSSQDNRRQTYDAKQSYSGDSEAGLRKASATPQYDFRGVAVTATNSDDVASTGLAIGAAAAVAVNLTGSVQAVNVSTQARIGRNARIDTLGTSPGQSVLVGAGNDFRSLGIAGGVSIAGVASVTPVAAVQIVNLRTGAIIDADATVNAGDSVVVRAVAFEKMTAVAAAVAGAVFAGVGIAPTITALDSRTTASIGGAGRATVLAGGSVGVLAEDNSRFTNVAATLGIGFAGVGLGGNVVLVTKSTQALVTDGSSVTANALPGRSAIGGVVDNLGSNAQGYAVQNRGNAVSGVVVQATSREDFTAITGSVGVGLAGVGLAADIVVVDSDAIARIGNNATVISGGSVVVGASNTLDVFTFAGAIGAGIAGVGGGVTVGIVRNGVSASIGDSAVVRAGGGAVEVIALSRKTVDSLDLAGAFGIGALAGSVGIWTFGGAVSTNYSYSDIDEKGNAGANRSDDALGGGSSGWNTKLDNSANGNAAPGGSYGSILTGQTGSGGNVSRVAAANQAAKPSVSAARPQTSITAQLNNTGTVEGTTARIGFGAQVAAAGSVIVRAKDATTVTQTAGRFDGGIASVGGSIALVTLNMAVQASIGSNAVVNAGAIFVGPGDIVVEATQVTRVKGFVFAGSGGLVTLGAQVLIVNDNTDQAAWVQSGASLTAFGNIVINATSLQSYSGGALGASFNAIGGGVSIVTVNVNGGTHALQDGNSNAIGSVSVVALADVSASLQTYGVGLSVLGGANGAVTLASISKSSEARIGDASNTAALGDVTVSAFEIASADLSSYAIQLAGVVGIGIAASIAKIDPAVTANAGGSYAMGGTLSVVVGFNTDAAGNRIADRGARTEAFSVGAALIAGITGAVAISTVSPLVLATINNGARVAGLTVDYRPNVVIRALSGSEAHAVARGIGVGLIGGLGASVAFATVTNVVQAHALGNQLQLGNANGRIGSVTVDARSVDDASAETFATGGGIFVGIAANEANASVTGAVTAQLGAGAAIFVRDATVNADEFGGATANSQGISLAGGVSGAASIANATHNVSVNALVDGSTVNTTGGLNIQAKTRRANAEARAVATGGALIAGLTVNLATANSTGQTNAALRNGVVLADITSPVRIHAEGFTDARSAAIGASFGIVGLGSAHATTVNTHRTDAEIGVGVRVGTSLQGQGQSGYNVGAIEVSAKSAGTGRVEAVGAGGGIGTAVDVFAEINVAPTARATVRENAALYGRSLLVDANNYAEGDGELAGRTVSAVDFSSLELRHNVVQTAEATIAGGVKVYTVNDMTVAARGGDWVPNERYEGVSMAKGGGFSVGIIGRGDGQVDTHVDSNVRAKILNGSIANYTSLIVGGSLTVSANAAAKANATTDNSGGGLGNLSSTTANSFIDARTEALIGDTGGVRSLRVYAYRDVNVTANANLDNFVSARDAGAGGISFSSTDGQARTFYRTTAAFGQGVGFEATNLTMNAKTTHHEYTKLDNVATGAGADSEAGATNSGSFASVGSYSSISIGSGADLVVNGAIRLNAELDGWLEAFTETHAQSGVGFSTAYATSIADDKVLITLETGSKMRANDGVYITGNVSNYKVRTQAKAYATTDFTDEDSYSQNYANVAIEIDAKPGSIVVTERNLSHPTTDADAALTVETKLNVTREAYVENDGTGSNGDDHYNGREKTDLPGEQDDRTGDRSKATITWNADVTLQKVNNPRVLEIDRNGVVTRADGITVDNYFDRYVFALFLHLTPPLNVGYQTGAVIHVDDITAPGEVHRAVFRATNNNVLITPGDDPVSEAPNAAGRNVITGDRGTWSVGQGASYISIVNRSANQLQINNIETIGTDTDPAKRSVSIQVENAVGFKFDVSPFYDQPSVTIRNENFGNGNGDIVINGLINNPVGTTYIDSQSARVLQGGSGGLIRTMDLTTYGAELGSYIFVSGGGGDAVPDQYFFDPVSIEFVHGAGGVPHANIYSDEVAIDVSTRLRNANLSQAQVDFDHLTAYKPYINFHAAKWDSQNQSDVSLPPAGVSVGTSSTPANNAAGISTARFYRSFYYPDVNGAYSAEVYSAFGTNQGNLLTQVIYRLPADQLNNFITRDSGVFTQFTLPANSSSFGSFMAMNSFAPDDADTFTVSSLDSETDGVTLAPAGPMNATETPFHTLAGDALMTYFGVTEADLAAISAGQQSPDVLVQNFIDLEPNSSRINRVTKPQILWQ